MNLEQLIVELKAERIRIDQAIAALENGASSSRSGIRSAGTRGPRVMSADARRRISEAQKKRWAKVRKSSVRGQRRKALSGAKAAAAAA